MITTTEPKFLVSENERARYLNESDNETYRGRQELLALTQGLLTGNHDLVKRIAHFEDRLNPSCSLFAHGLDFMNWRVL
jgi:hypothetical protein